MKNKETLEEATKNFLNTKQEFYFKKDSLLWKFLIKISQFGAKWQQERSYSEEDMKSAYEQGARLALLSQPPLALHNGEFPNPEEWFNQYKEENKLWI